MPLYPYQERVYDLLASGQSVILQAPTGAGKTRAALYPFLRAWEYGDAFPRKCLYAVPMRVLANQFFEEYATLVDSYQFLNPPAVTIQTGEHRSDPRFEGDLVFTTIDQLLSSFLVAPYALPRRLSNLNAGAVTGSYLVFDEFHLFEPTSTLPTTLAMLKMLQGISPFLLMTATFSGDMLEGLGRQLGAVVVPEDEVSQHAMQAIPSQHKTRYYHVSEEPLTAGAVLERHRGRTLAVCNVVDRARRLFEDLRQSHEIGDTQVILLHSRFLPEDRTRIETQIRATFAHSEAKGDSWIAVSTQAIEVGLNITCDTLHTELAPANAILQRAGRCARYAGETGDVYIYGSSSNTGGDLVDLTETAWPYQDQREVIGKTQAAFCQFQGRAVTFADEQTVVSLAHGEEDRQTLLGLEATQTHHTDAMASVIDGRREATAGNLVRAVSSQLVVIHDEPEVLLDHPFNTDAFSLHPGTVRGQVSKWLKSGQLVPGYIRVLTDVGDSDESGHSTYTWRPVNDAQDLRGAALVAIHPALAGYDSTRGLVLGEPTGFRSKTALGGHGQLRERYAYRLEPYEEHVDRVLRAFRLTVWPKLRGAAERMEGAFGWSPGLVERAAHLVVLLHDVGKLRDDWQGWVQDYQRAIRRDADPSQAYAHTDSDPFDPLHNTQQRAQGQRPSHAVEGATAVAPLLLTALDACEPLVKAAFTAIARHHGAFVRQGQPYQLIQGAVDVVSRTVALAPDDITRQVDAHALWTRQHPTESRIRGLIAAAERRKEVLPYMLLARALRLSDQYGTAAGTAAW